MPIDPSFALSGADMKLDSVGFGTDPNAAEVQGTEGSGSGSFGSMLSNSIKSLSDTQSDAAKASTDLATGATTDTTAVVMAVEKAQLSMQLASQLRTKAVEATQEIFRTTV